MSRAARWVDAMLDAAYPQTAGVTRAALEALAGQESYTPAQLAYVMAVMTDVGAMARTAGDRAELEASWRSGFRPQPAREERIRVRSAEATRLAEIEWLRRTGHERQDWPGGTAESALARFMWDDDRPDLTDPGPSAAQWHPGVGVPVRRVNGRWSWRDEA